MLEGAFKLNERMPDINLKWYKNTKISSKNKYMNKFIIFVWYLHFKISIGLKRQMHKNNFMLMDA
jgi:hypothetical protein